MIWTIKMHYSLVFPSQLAILFFMLKYTSSEFVQEIIYIYPFVHTISIDGTGIVSLWNLLRTPHRLIWGKTPGL